jgi:serine/threonine protein kinase
VAVKVVPVPGDDDADRVARELSVLACTSVDGLVGFHESVGLDTEPPAVAIVLDLAQGGSLARAVGARGQLSAGEAVTVLAAVARALAGLHAAGVVHGDVSPGNVLLELTGRPLLADVGVARLLGEGPGEVFGTEGFVAPEVAAGAPPTTASDVYAVGALAWWCVTGAPPGPAALRRPLAEVEPGLPGLFLEWTVRAMSGDPAQRPDAASLAVGYFEAAECVPLRLVVGSDDTSLLTRRLRDSADRARVSDGDPGPGARGRQALRRARGARAGTRRGLVGRAVLATAVVGAVVCGVAVASGVTTWPEVPLVHPGGQASGSPGRPVAATSTPRLSAEGSAHSPRPSSSPSRSLRRDPATDRGSPQRDPRGLMQSLADRRAAVMTSASQAALSELDVQHSAAMAADRSLVRSLVTAGERYAEVRLTVRSARPVSSDGDTVRVEAVVDTSAHVVLDRAGRATPRAAVTGQPMVFTMQWASGRWRIASVEGLSR